MEARPLGPAAALRLGTRVARLIVHDALRLGPGAPLAVAEGKDYANPTRQDLAGSMPKAAAPGRSSPPHQRVGSLRNPRGRRPHLTS